MCVCACVFVCVCVCVFVCLSGCVYVWGVKGAVGMVLEVAWSLKHPWLEPANTTRSGWPFRPLVPLDLRSAFLYVPVDAVTSQQPGSRACRFCLETVPLPSYVTFTRPHWGLATSKVTEVQEKKGGTVSHFSLSLSLSLDNSTFFLSSRWTINCYFGFQTKFIQVSYSNLYTKLEAKLVYCQGRDRLFRLHISKSWNDVSKLRYNFQGFR